MYSFNTYEIFVENPFPEEAEFKIIFQNENPIKEVNKNNKKKEKSTINMSLTTDITETDMSNQSFYSKSNVIRVKGKDSKKLMF